MSDPFELVANGDLDGLRAALAYDPGLVDKQHASGATLVAWAAYMGNVGAIAAVRARLRELSPHEAIILGDNARLSAALAAGWSADARAPDGFTPLALAAFFDNGAAFELLLPLTGDINAAADNPQRVAALHAAASKRNAGLAEKLLKAGADPNQLQEGGCTPLHAAAQHGDAATAGLLLLFGADKALRTAKGESAAQLAQGAGHDWLAARLS